MINRRILSTNLVQTLILDEADEMLSSSFREQVREIVGLVPQEAQICLFSATMPYQMVELANKFLKNHVNIFVKREQLTLEGIEQYYIEVNRDDDKFETICDIYGMITISQSIIYVNTVKSAEMLKERLTNSNFEVSVINGKMPSMERSNIMKEFRSGNTRILISTDLLSRGIDIQQVSIVINYDLPNDIECYLHRIGRSGRFGRRGVAINFVSRKDERKMRDIEQFYSDNRLCIH